MIFLFVMICRELHPEEIKEIVDIHLEAFADFFLTSLGKSFLKTYYKTVLRNKKCIAVCATDEDNKIVGFGIGSELSKGFHKRILCDNLGTYLWLALIIMFTRPLALLRLVTNMDKKYHEKDDGNYAELLSIGILSRYKGQGIGKLLVRCFEKEAMSRNCKKMTLTTDYYNNDSVIEFYKRSGYKVFYEFIAYPDRRMYKFIKEL